MTRNLLCFTGYDISGLSAEDGEKWESRRLLQDFDIDSNYTDDVPIGTNADKNCTPPGKKLHTSHTFIVCLFFWDSRQRCQNTCVAVDLAGQILERKVECD